jgi:Family of unknown function (DUF6029)
MKKIQLFISFLFFSFILSAQKDLGHFGGSFESFTQYYHKDDKINAVVPQDKIGSNNFLKLDYNYKKFTAGIQFEAYLPAIQGYPYMLNESKLVNKYFKYNTQNFSVQVGDFYEQFGSGLVFRAWENRQIGINNALEGANVHVSPLPFLNLKAVYGRQRKVFEYSNSNIRGLDAEIDFSKTGKTTPTTRVAAGFSYVSRYQLYTGPVTDFPATVNATSTRLDIGGGTASVSLEYVHKKRDPHEANNFDNTSGKAFLTNLTLAKNNFGGLLTFRTLENMDSRSERESIQSVGLMNFIPAITRQHDYLTTNIYVYNAQSMGEIGGQLDLFYNAPKGTRLGGKFGSKFSLNFSSYRGHESMNDLFSFGDDEYFRDLNLEWKKKWSDKFSTIVLYQHVLYNRLVIEGEPFPDVKTHTVVLNALLKYAKKKAFRFELQHLATKQDRGNWAAALTEFSFAPSWTFYLSDLYNYGVTDTHYATVGGSFTKGGTRFGLSYGRQRAGLFCVGGVCRFVPAATGITATLTTTF